MSPAPAAMVSGPPFFGLCGRFLADILFSKDNLLDGFLKLVALYRPEKGTLTR